VHEAAWVASGAEANAFLDSWGSGWFPKPSALIKRGGAWFQSESVRLHLGVEKDFHPARKAHPAFIVYDLEVMLEMVQQAGYEWDESQPALDGYKRAHIYDPFGNRIELLEPI
jgi:catechol 2,3-dioxygenase-like lactoylglutathione lyase family enzyme